MAAKAAYHKDPLLWILAVGVLCTCWFMKTPFWLGPDDGLQSTNQVAISAPLMDYAIDEKSLRFRLFPDSYTLRYTMNGAVPSAQSKAFGNERSIADLRSEIPQTHLHNTSPIWKRPLSAPPVRGICRVAFFQGEHRVSEVHNILLPHYLEKRDFGIPTVHISTHPDNLFSYGEGIYTMGASVADNANFQKDKAKLKDWWWDYPANYHQRGKEWEREVALIYEDGETQLSTTAGMRINGNATRSFPKKSLRFYARSKYGSDQFNVNFFEDEQEVFTQFILRNGGNDWKKSIFRDVFAQKLFEKAALTRQRSKMVEVYLNGTYWGIYNIRDRFSEGYFEGRYNLPEEEVTILEKNGAIEHGTEEAAEAFKALVNYAREKDLSEEEHFQYIANNIDIQSLADFMIAEMYLVNTDWPENNVKYFRVPNTTLPELGAGKWYWMIYDTDYGMGYTDPNTYTTNMLQLIDGKDDVAVVALFKALLAHPSFRKLVKERWQFFRDGNLQPQQALAICDSLEAEYSKAIQRNIDRWREPSSVDEWKQNIQTLRTFVSERPAYFEKHLAAYLNAFE